VDDPEALSRITDALEVIQQDQPVILPIHPRTRHMLAAHGITQRWDELEQLNVIEPLGYLDFLKLMSEAGVVLTDSGGIQEETTILGVWCLTLRENTERPITLTEGTSTLVGSDPERIISAYRACRAESSPAGAAPAKWDGQAAERIARILADHVPSDSGADNSLCLHR